MNASRNRKKQLMAVSALLLLLFFSVAKGNNPAQSQNYDLAIVNGRVMDPESGLDAVRSVGIRNGKIVAISSEALKGIETIDARGLVVAPGFIDLHQHGQDAENYAAKAADGVTTALELEVGVTGLDEWYGEREGKALINFGASAGHIPARMAVMHDPGTFLPSGPAAHKVATPLDIQAVLALVEKDLKRGALAVGLGPAYTEAATSEEILEVFRLAAKYNASCHVHIRGSASPGPGNFSGFQEVLADAVTTGAALHVVHIQSTGGQNVLQELKMIGDAQARGLDVTTESYPYTMGMTSIQAAMFDHKENENPEYYSGLLWPATGEHLNKESFLKYRKQGGWVILPSNTQDNIHAAIVSPLTMIASDGYISHGTGHPRTAGTYALVLGRYVREEKSLELMAALKKMTLMPAQRLERRAPVFKNKGRLRIGADADITVFDPLRVIDRATYEKPMLHSEGIQFLLVNGIGVIKDGRMVQDVFPGRGLRAPIKQ